MPLFAMENEIFHRFENLEISNLTGVRSLRFIRKIKEKLEPAPYSLIYLLFLESQKRENKIMEKIDKNKANSLTLREETLKPFLEWTRPNPEEIKVVCDSIGKSSVIGSLVGVNGSNVRKYIGGHKEIPYSVWALICYEAGLGSIWS